MGPHQAEYCVNSQNYTALGDSLVMCRFVMERGFAARLEQPLVDVVNMVTGWDVTIDELRKTGERIYTLERLINTQRGITRKDDTLPWRVMNEPIPDGPCKGRYCPKDELDPMLDRYYELRGWDSNGIPTADKLKELGLI
jgi:aldehyde:ferredoxin oxidoreductase